MSDTADFSGMTVLLAEDIEVSRVVTAALLKRIGVGDVIAVDDGRAALNALVAGDKHFDLLIADIDMPRLDGLTLAQKIKSGDEGANPELPIVILTGNTDDAYREAAHMRGVISFLAKPPKFDSLREALVAVAAGDKP